MIASPPLSLLTLLGVARAFFEVGVDDGDDDVDEEEDVLKYDSCRCCSCFKAAIAGSPLECPEVDGAPWSKEKDVSFASAALLEELPPGLEELRG